MTRLKRIWQTLAVFQRAEFLSPRDLLQRAGAISLLFLAVHLAGFREEQSLKAQGGHRGRPR